MIGKLFRKEYYDLLKYFDVGKVSEALDKTKYHVEDYFPQWETYTVDEQCAKGIRLLVGVLPIMLFDYDLLCGVATHENSANHRFPLYYKNDRGYKSISHTTLEYKHVLKSGYQLLQQEIKERLTDNSLDKTQKAFLNSQLDIIDSALIWHGRIITALRNKIEASTGEVKEIYNRVLENAKNVPYHGATNFKEAVQSLWFIFNFLRLCSAWPGIGRLDEILYPYYEKDLRDGKITYAEAREYLAWFWLHGVEWARIGASEGTGDGQFYQNVLICGVNSEGIENENDISHIVLDIIEDTGIGDFPISVRLNSNTSERIYRRIAQIVKQGRGILAVYNEDIVIKNLVEFGYSLIDARNFTNDGCWEILIPGKTTFSYHSFDALKILQETTGMLGDTIPDFKSMDEVLEKFTENFNIAINKIRNRIDSLYEERIAMRPSTHVCLFMPNTIKTARSYYDRGPEFRVRAPHPGGLPDVCNNLIAINDIVFKNKKLSYKEFIGIIQNNWEGYEELRQYALKNIVYYGNDSKEADDMMKLVFKIFKDLVNKEKTRNGNLFPAGSSTFTRELSEYLNNRSASATGHLKGTVLACNSSPTPSTDLNGPTAVLKSFCNIGFEGLANGTALDLKILEKTVEGENGTLALMTLYKAFVKLNGIFMQPDVVKDGILKDAYLNPENHQSLALRISGWSSRFVTLEKEFQLAMINRSEQKL